MSVYLNNKFWQSLLNTFHVIFKFINIQGKFSIVKLFENHSHSLTDIHSCAKEAQCKNI